MTLGVVIGAPRDDGNFILVNVLSAFFGPRDGNQRFLTWIPLLKVQLLCIFGVHRKKGMDVEGSYFR